MPISTDMNLVDRIDDLVNQHRALQDEPLLLAIYFEPDRNPGDIFLFEVIEGFGADSVEEDRKLFEVSYASSSNFPLPQGRHLHLILTSPKELEIAARERWPSLLEIQKAIKSGKARTVFTDPKHPDIEAKVNA